jgi:glutaredoxin
LTIIEIFGIENCSRCIMAKKILDKKGVKYIYYSINDIPIEEQKNKEQLAKQNGIFSFPLIFKDNKIVKLEDINDVF